MKLKQNYHDLPRPERLRKVKNNTNGKTYEYFIEIYTH